MCLCLCFANYCFRKCFSFGYYNFIPNLESCLSSHPFDVLIFCFSEKLIRLKQAKEEAEKDIAAYRAQMEREFQRKVAESSGDSGANVKRLEKETDERIHHLKAESEKISDGVVQMLLKHVTSVKN
ncbi:hypothetical protein Ddye_011093 [Dipteronia dyeriana]|uniref:V-type proton ATPase subunit G n=1 Tax=Dipteronia dyeriana TaxID=168575 RepID=A0AAD9XF38_9ROSI|nr:hypothetical protein Ddye_011093 [Dipteronia dyeriana]